MEQLFAEHPAFMEDPDFEWPNFPKRSQEEIDEDIQYFVNHPLNAKKITPEMLEMPEFQALAALLHEGSPDEIAKNFMNHGYDYLNKVILKESKEDQKDIEQAIYCFDEGLEYAKDIQDKGLLYQLYMGRAKTNILISQFGRTKDDCLQALKYRETEQAFTVLARSRIFVERYREAIEYCEKGLKKIPDSKVIKSVMEKAKDEEKKELQRVNDVCTMQSLAKDTKLAVYRNMRSKKIKLGKRVHFLPEIVEVNISEGSKGELHFPVLILYDEVMGTDFIQDWPENSTLKDQLAPVFSEQAPWDQEGKYRMNNIEVYFEADSTVPLDPKDKSKDKSTKKYIQCSMEQTLLEVLQHRHHIIPQYPVLKVVAKKSAFREAFLKEI